MLGKRYMGLLKGIKGMQVLLSASQTPSRSQPMNRWGQLAYRSPLLAHGHSPVLLAPHPTNPQTKNGSLSVLLMIASVIFGRLSSKFAYKTHKNM